MRGTKYCMIGDKQTLLQVIIENSKEKIKFMLSLSEAWVRIC